MTKTNLRWPQGVLMALTVVTVQACGSSEGTNHDATVPGADGGLQVDSTVADAPQVTALDTAAVDLSVHDSNALDSASLDRVPIDVAMDTPIDSAVDVSAIDRPAFDSVIDTGPVTCGDGGVIGGPSSLIANGSFECPVVGPGSYTNYSTGQKFFGWTVVGANANVSVLSGAFVSGGYQFPAHEGGQTIDLTGYSDNAAAGIAQTVTTVPGTTYHLSFWVGNLNVPNSQWGTSSTVNVLVNGVQTLAAKNEDGLGSKTIVWKQFTRDFTATTASTTIAFMNGDPSNDNSNLLDDITLN